MVILLVNKINPLYILIVTICLFLYSIIELNLSNDNLLQIKEENKNFIKIATKYNTLQKAWGINNNIQKRCENFLKLSGIRDAHITTNTKIIKIKIRNADLKSLDKFMNKLLNKTIIILNFSLTKNSLDLEIGL